MQKSSGNAQKLPPGPNKLPFIGNLHQLLGSLPHHSLKKLADKYGPLMHLQLGELSTIIVSSPKLAKEVLQTNSLAFANRPQLVVAKIIQYNNLGVSFCPYGDYWRQMRQIYIMELLSAKSVQSFFSIMEDELSYLVGSIEAEEGPLLAPRECREECTISGYNIPINTVTIVNAWAIGRDPEYWNDPEKFNPERFSDKSIDFRGNNFELIPFGAGKRVCPGISYGVTNVELVLANLLYHFDWKLPQGINPQDLDMTEYWNDPEKFNPERFSDKSIDFRGNNFELIPFGAGKRVCPGISYGVTNVELVLANLLYHFDWKLPQGINPQDLDMTEVFGASAGRKNNLYLDAKIYIPSNDH
ncbi:unnamed protein product [Coffea canephora]|uniref:DH200=94 genomic scaffold, scaffold_2195 n=1 Tax=Coffea canephora TaxID=49390 RepID=A0A068VK64_COFCA|nr:unnamed protein product [Coffea canephora]